MKAFCFVIGLEFAFTEKLSIKTTGDFFLGYRSTRKMLKNLTPKKRFSIEK